MIADAAGLLLREPDGRTREVPCRLAAVRRHRRAPAHHEFDLAALYPRFEIRARRSDADWTFEFIPRDPDVARSLGEIFVGGTGSDVHHLEFRRTATQRVEISVGDTRSGVPFTPATRSRDSSADGASPPEMGRAGPPPHGCRRRDRVALQPGPEAQDLDGRARPDPDRRKVARTLHGAKPRGPGGGEGAAPRPPRLPGKAGEPDADREQRMEKAARLFSEALARSPAIAQAMPLSDAGPREAMGAAIFAQRFDLLLPAWLDERRREYELAKSSRALERRGSPRGPPPASRPTSRSRRPLRPRTSSPPIRSSSSRDSSARLGGMAGSRLHFGQGRRRRPGLGAQPGVASFRGGAGPRRRGRRGRP